MSLTVLVAGSALILLAIGFRSTDPEPHGAVFWWTWSAFGLPMVYSVVAANGLVSADDPVVGQLALVPMIVLGLFLVVRAARGGGSLSAGALLAVAPVVVTSAHVLDGYSLLTPLQALLVTAAPLVVPAGGYDVDEVHAGLRRSLQTGALALLVSAVLPTALGPCRVDKCSLWGEQIGISGSNVNVLGMMLAFLGVVAVLRLSWPRAVLVLVAVLALVDLSSSRSALLPLAIGTVAVVVERVLRGSLVGVVRAALVVVTVGGIVAVAVLPWLPSDATGRGGLWLRARRLIGERPLLGYGDSYWVRLPVSTWFWSNYSAHNLLLELLVAFGAVGATLVLGGVVVSRFAVPAPALRLWWLVIICWLAGGVTEVISGPGRVYLYAGVFVLPFLLLAGARPVARAPVDVARPPRAPDAVPEGVARHVDHSV